MSGPDLLARLDRIMAELAELRAAVAASMPAAEGNGADQFAPEHLLEISTAVERFNRPADTAILVQA